MREEGSGQYPAFAATPSREQQLHRPLCARSASRSGGALSRSSTTACYGLVQIWLKLSHSEPPLVAETNPASLIRLQIVNLARKLLRRVLLIVFETCVKMQPILYGVQLVFFCLLEMGGLQWDKVVHQHEGWRLVSAMWLHAGVIHILANMISLVVIGIRLEQQFGVLRVGIVYLVSGLGGSTLSALFLRQSISVGASGALFGLLGAMLSELLINWTIYANKVLAGLLGVEAGQDAVIRTYLYERRHEMVHPYKITVADFTARIAKLRNTLGNCGIKDEGVLIPPELGAEGNSSTNVLSSNQDSISFERTPAEVLRIMYVTGNEHTPGGLYPKGANGRIAKGFLNGN